MKSGRKQGGWAWGCHGHRQWVLALPLPVPPGSSTCWAQCSAWQAHVHAGFSTVRVRLVCSAVHGRLVCSAVHGRLICSAGFSAVHGSLSAMRGSAQCMAGSCAVQCMAGLSAVRAQWWTLCSRRFLRSPNVSPGGILSLEGMVWSLPLSLLPL